jgi:hypothetical protein
VNKWFSAICGPPGVKLKIRGSVQTWGYARAFFSLQRSESGHRYFLNNHVFFRNILMPA